MNSQFAVIALLGYALSATAVAQEQTRALSDVPPPTPPLVAEAPDPSGWTITIKPAGSGPAAPASNPSLPPKYLKQQSWTKSGEKMRCVNEWNDGRRTVDWIAGAVKFHESPQGEGIKLFNPSSHPTHHDFSKGDFDMLDWLTLDDYVGAVEYQGEPCYLFRSKRLAPRIHGDSHKRDFSAAEFRAPTSPTTALISVRTKLPVFVANADGQFQFRFQSVAPGELNLPEPYASLWRALNVKR